MTPLEAIKQIKETIMLLFHGSESGSAKTVQDRLLSLLSQAEAGLVCPVCKGSTVSSEVPTDIRDDKSYNKPFLKTCSACNGKGELLSFLKNQYDKVYDETIEQVKQIAEQKAEIKKRDTVIKQLVDDVAEQKAEIERLQHE
jgi:hypothetical protein